MQTMASLIIAWQFRMCLVQRLSPRDRDSPFLDGFHPLDSRDRRDSDSHYSENILYGFVWFRGHPSAVGIALFQMVATRLARAIEGIEIAIISRIFSKTRDVQSRQNLADEASHPSRLTPEAFFSLSPPPMNRKIPEKILSSRFLSSATTAANLASERSSQEQSGGHGNFILV